MGIWPLNPHVVDNKMGPSLAFVETFEDVDQSSRTKDDANLKIDDPLIAKVVGDRVSESQLDHVQYNVKLMGRAPDVGEGEHKPESIPCDLTVEEGGPILAAEFDCRIQSLLELPRIRRPPKKPKSSKVSVDYLKSIILTKDENIHMMAEKERKKEAALKEKETRKLEADQNKLQHHAQKLQREAEKKQKALEVEAF